MNPPLTTSRTVREMRAEMLLAAAAARPELVGRLEDLRRLPRIAGWSPSVLGAAIDDLAAAGAFAEAADGRLVVEPARWAT